MSCETGKTFLAKLQNFQKYVIESFIVKFTINYFAKFT